MTCFRSPAHVCFGNSPNYCYYYEELDQIPSSCMTSSYMTNCTAHAHQLEKVISFARICTHGSTHCSAHAACNSTKVWVMHHCVYSIDSVFQYSVSNVCCVNNLCVHLYTCTVYILVDCTLSNKQTLLPGAKQMTSCACTINDNNPQPSSLLKKHSTRNMTFYWRGVTTRVTNTQ